MSKYLGLREEVPIPGWERMQCAARETGRGLAGNAGQVQGLARIHRKGCRKTGRYRIDITPAGHCRPFVRPGGHRRCLPEVGRRQAPRRSAGSCRTSAQRLRYRPQVDASGALAQQRVRGFGTGGASGGHVVHERDMQAVDRTVDQ